MALGYKTIETRGWPTKYRGALCIHAGAFMDMDAFESFRGLLTAPTLPRRCILAIVNLYDCVTTEELQPDRFGDYSPRRFGWKTKGLTKLDTPILCRGYQKIWTVPEEVEKRVNLEAVRAFNAMTAREPSLAEDSSVLLLAKPYGSPPRV